MSPRASFVSMSLLLVVVALALSLASEPSAVGLQTRRASARPNIIIIALDDVGFSDLRSYGSEIATPYIDSLAKRGLRYVESGPLVRSSYHAERHVNVPMD